MALGLLKIAGSVAKGVGNFIKKRKAKKAKKIEKAAAKLEARKAALAGIGGYDTIGAGGFSLKSLSSDFGNLMNSDVIKASSVAQAMGSREDGGGNTETAGVASATMGAGSVPVWLIPVIGLALLLFVFKKK